MRNGGHVNGCTYRPRRFGYCLDILLEEAVLQIKTLGSFDRFAVRFFFEGTDADELLRADALVRSALVVRAN